MESKKILLEDNKIYSSVELELMFDKAGDHSSSCDPESCIHQQLTAAMERTMEYLKQRNEMLTPIGLEYDRLVQENQQLRKMLQDMKFS